MRPLRGARRQGHTTAHNHSQSFLVIHYVKVKLGFGVSPYGGSNDGSDCHESKHPEPNRVHLVVALGGARLKQRDVRAGREHLGGFRGTTLLLCEVALSVLMLWLVVTTLKTEDLPEA
jgi:hypothetical protein